MMFVVVASCVVGVGRGFDEEGAAVEEGAAGFVVVGVRVGVFVSSVGVAGVGMSVLRVGVVGAASEEGSDAALKEGTAEDEHQDT
jgi:hypothetical protein